MIYFRIGKNFIRDMMLCLNLFNISFHTIVYFTDLKLDRLILRFSSIITQCLSSLCIKIKKGNCLLVWLPVTVVVAGIVVAVVGELAVVVGLVVVVVVVVVGAVELVIIVAVVDAEKKMLFEYFVYYSFYFFHYRSFSFCYLIIKSYLTWPFSSFQWLPRLCGPIYSTT